MGSSRRTYGDACGVARALDLVGERWALMVVRELLLGPKRFTDLRTGLAHISADVLAQRLRELEDAGVLARRRLPPPAAAQVYELTPWGQELEPVITGLGRFGAKAPPPPPDARMSIDAHALSMRTLFDPELAGDLEARVALHLGDHHFRAIVADGRASIERGDPPEADATIATDPGTLIDVLHGRRDLDEALAAGALRIDGDEPLARRVMTLFPLPGQAPVSLPSPG